MIAGIGLDLIELSRIEQSVKKNEKIVSRILTHKEKEIFDRFSSERRKLEFLAGRFAAKEAFAKAAGVGIGRLSFQHIEVLTNEGGAPFITVKGYEDERIFISITHSETYAAAQVVIEKG